MGEWCVPLSVEPEAPGLDHVVLAGGTPREWLQMGLAVWADLLKDLARSAANEGAHWITVLPHHGEALTPDDLSHFLSSLLSLETSRQVGPSRVVWSAPNGSHVIVDPSPDGHERFAATVESLRVSGMNPDSLTEEHLSRHILAPAQSEADLVLIVGSPDRIPDSMVWELAYSELVFIDVAWSQFNANHLELAIDDFNRRHRRFGGLDS